jgi:hypothetical protein
VRFVGSEVELQGTHFELLPFGVGRRICPGIAMALMNVEFTLANMLCGFDWALPEGVKKEDVCMEEAAACSPSAARLHSPSCPRRTAQSHEHAIVIFYVASACNQFVYG